MGTTSDSVSALSRLAVRGRARLRRRPDRHDEGALPVLPYEEEVPAIPSRAVRDDGPP